MPIVKASENPIPINEEVLDEGLIDAIRQGANYLKDRRTIRRFNKLNSNHKRIVKNTIATVLPVDLSSSNNPPSSLSILVS